MSSKEAVLIFDEVAIRRELCYDSVKDEIVGCVYDSLINIYFIFIATIELISLTYMGNKVSELYCISQNFAHFVWNL